MRVVFLIVFLCVNLPLKYAKENKHKAPLFLSFGHVTIPLKPNFPDSKVESHKLNYESDDKWKLLNYAEAWKNYEEYLKVNRYSSEEKALMANEANTKFVAFLYTMNMVSKSIIESDWDYLDSVIESAKMYPIKAINNPTLAANTVECYLEEITKSLQRFSRLLSNEWIKFICYHVPDSCSAVIFVLMKISPDSEPLAVEAEFLLELFEEIPEDYFENFNKTAKTAEKDPVKFITNESSKEQLSSLLDVHVNIQAQLFVDEDTCTKSDVKEKLKLHKKELNAKSLQKRKTLARLI